MVTIVMLVFFSLIVYLLFLLVKFSNSSFNYWKKKNVPEVFKPSFPLGSLRNQIFKIDHVGVFFKNMYLQARSQKLKHFGAYQFFTPKYNPIDPEYIKNILQVDWKYFTERGIYFNEKDDPLSANLFAIGGEKWRCLRTKLSPAFTPGKLKIVPQDIIQFAYQMLDGIKNICKNKQVINISDVSECYTIDVIGLFAFGIQCNSFKNPDAIFPKQGRKIFHFTIFRTAKTAFSLIFSDLARKLGVRLFDKETTGFFLNVVEEAFQYRKVNKCVRRDFLQLLFELWDDVNDYDETRQTFSIKELTAQAFIFFAAGFETSSLTLAYCLYELSLNQEIQNKVREEVNQVLIEHDGKVNYDSIMDMKYLDQVLNETLRKYPPVPYITRKCVKDYQVPGTETILDKGTELGISILGLHHDPEYYPDPDKYDPERFSEESKSNRHPCTYLPFGEGPRICIGLRFGLMQTKIGLLTLLRCYRFSLNKKTKVPLEINPFSFTLAPKSGIFLNAEIVNYD